MDSAVNLFVHRENQQWAKPKPPLPVTLITGFLGSGKTTLLRHILAKKENLNIAFAINDIAGDVDSEIIKRESDSGPVIALNNGCSCCSLVNDLKLKVYDLHQEKVNNNGQIDYLIVETSGVTDPKRIISVLDENFGKMYYIRLDCVVTVVDTDFLKSSIENDDVGFAARSQLCNADIVLLNKIDLISDPDIQYVRDYIQQTLKSQSLIYTTKYAAVPLPFILDIEDPTTTPQGVSHDKTVQKYLISATGKTRRIIPSTDTKPGQVSHDHLREDSFNSTVFTSPKPFHLDGFQNFLLSLDDSVVRIKGTIYFTDQIRKRFTFHMSGRHRFEIIDSGEWDIAASCSLVVIGKNIDIELIQERLNAATQDQVCPQGWDSLHSTLAADNRFEVYGLENNIVHFRVTGYTFCGFTEEAAVSLHGVNLNSMNLDLVRKFNSAPGSFFLSYFHEKKDNKIILKMSTKANFDREKYWELFTVSTNSVIEQYFKDICGCRRFW